MQDAYPYITYHNNNKPVLWTPLKLEKNTVIIPALF